MRLVFAAAMIVMLAASACAQSLHGKAPPGPQPAAPKSRQEIEAERSAEQAYKNSLRNIPDQPAADPWGNARGLDVPTTTAKSVKANKPPAKTGSAAN